MGVDGGAGSRFVTQASSVAICTLCEGSSRVSRVSRVFQGFQGLTGFSGFSVASSSYLTAAATAAVVPLAPASACATDASPFREARASAALPVDEGSLVARASDVTRVATFMPFGIKHAYTRDHFIAVPTSVSTSTALRCSSDAASSSTVKAATSVSTEESTRPPVGTRATPTGNWVASSDDTDHVVSPPTGTTSGGPP